MMWLSSMKFELRPQNIDSGTVLCCFVEKVFVKLCVKHNVDPTPRVASIQCYPTYATEYEQQFYNLRQYVKVETILLK